MEVSEIEPTGKQTKYWAMLCGVLAGLVYLGTLSFHFVYDDVGQIVDNSSIRSWRFLPQYFSSHMWAGVFDFSSYYRPLDLLWFRLNYFFFGLQAAGWHATSIVAHALATFLVFRLVLRILHDVRIALLSALIFGLHPVHVQSVAWVSGVADPLLTIFMAASFISYLNFSETKKVVWICWSLLWYACAALTKEPGILLPVFIFAHEWIMPKKEEPSRGILGRLKDAGAAVAPFLGISILYLAARMRALGTFIPPATNMSVSQIVLSWPAVLWLDTKHLLLPCGYSLYYDLPFVSHFFSKEFLTAASLLVLTIGIAIGIARWLKVDRRVLLVGLVWLIVPLLPSLFLNAIRPEIFAQDRYLYISCIGFSVLLGSVIVRVSELQLLVEHSKSIRRYAAVLLPLILASCTLAQQQYWVSNVALFRRAVAIAPNNFDAIANLGVALSKANQFRPAISLFEQALQRDPNSAHLNYNYGYAFYCMRDYPDALPHLARAAQLDPQMGEAFLYIGMSHLKLGFPQDAAFEIRHAIALEPDRRGAHLALGAVLEIEGDLPGAIAETRTEANSFPDDPIIRQRVLALEQRWNQSRNSKAVSSDPAS